MLRLTNTDDNYHMIRSRFHADFWYQDKVRLFAEFIDARTFGQALSPLPTDVNHTDMLNLFADVKVATVKDAPAYIRFGRQELLIRVAAADFNAGLGEYAAHLPGRQGFLAHADLRSGRFLGAPDDHANGQFR